jgi:hypothetical protein
MKRSRRAALRGTGIPDFSLAAKPRFLSFFSEVYLYEKSTYKGGCL